MQRTSANRLAALSRTRESERQSIAGSAFGAACLAVLMLWAAGCASEEARRTQQAELEALRSRHRHQQDLLAETQGRVRELTRQSNSLVTEKENLVDKLTTALANDGQQDKVVAQLERRFEGLHDRFQETLRVTESLQSQQEELTERLGTPPSGTPSHDSTPQLALTPPPAVPEYAPPKPGPAAPPERAVVNAGGGNSAVAQRGNVDNSRTGSTTNARHGSGTAVGEGSAGTPPGGTVQTTAEGRIGSASDDSNAAGATATVEGQGKKKLWFFLVFMAIFVGLVVVVTKVTLTLLARHDKAVPTEDEEPPPPRSGDGEFEELEEGDFEDGEVQSTQELEAIDPEAVEEIEAEDEVEVYDAEEVVEEFETRIEALEGDAPTADAKAERERRMRQEAAALDAAFDVPSDPGLEAGAERKAEGRATASPESVAAEADSLLDLSELSTPLEELAANIGATAGGGGDRPGAKPAGSASARSVPRKGSKDAAAGEPAPPRQPQSAATQVLERLTEDDFGATQVIPGLIQDDSGRTQVLPAFTPSPEEVTPTQIIPALEDPAQPQAESPKSPARTEDPFGATQVVSGLPDGAFGTTKVMAAFPLDEAGSTQIMSKEKFRKTTAQARRPSPGPASSRSGNSGQEAERALLDELEKLLETPTTETER